MKTEIINITPELAKEWLGKNFEKNRTIRTSYVSQLADVMRSGRFIAENGQTIVFGDDGKLYDGQHRLSAIVESGCAQELLVVSVHDAERAYGTMDNGTKRQAADFLMEFPNRNNAAAYGKVMACVEWSSVPLVSCLQGKWDTGGVIDRGLIVSYCNTHPDETKDAVRTARNMLGEVGCGAVSMYSAFIGVVRYVKKDVLLDEFINDFLLPAPDSKTVASAKRMIMKESISGRGQGTKWLFGLLLDAYAHYCQMDESMMLNKKTMRIKQYSKLVEEERARRAEDRNHEKN